METAVADLAADSGPLLSVRGVAAPAGRYRRLEFEFTAGVLTLRCDDATDKIIVEVGRHGRDAESIEDSWAQALLGKWTECAWGLRNHRGYNDGFQLRFMNDEGEEESRQFEVAGSAIEVRLVTPGNAAA
jgi:hypothetical protein